QEMENPDRDAERHPHQQSGDQVATHEPAFSAVGLQWQPQLGPHALGAAAALFGWELLASEPAPSVLVSVLPSVFPSDLPSVLAGLLPFLKSVAYQPEPLSWNPAAETSFVRLSVWQEGNVDSGGSDSFCSTSCSLPQDEQRYS